MTEVPRKPTFPQHMIRKVIQKIQHQVDDQVIPVSTGIYTEEKLVQKLQAIPKPIIEDYGDSLFFQIVEKAPVCKLEKCPSCQEQFSHRNQAVFCHFCSHWNCTSCICQRKRLHPRDSNPNGKRYEICCKCDSKFLNLLMCHNYVQNRMLLERAITTVSRELDSIQNELQQKKTEKQTKSSKPKMENNIKISKLKKVQLDNKKFLKKIDYQQAEGREKSNKLEKQKLKFEEIYKEKMKQKERRELQFQLEQQKQKKRIQEENIRYSLELEKEKERRQQEQRKRKQIQQEEERKRKQVEELERIRIIQEEVKRKKQKQRQLQQQKQIQQRKRRVLEEQRMKKQREQQQNRKKELQMKKRLEEQIKKKEEYMKQLQLEKRRKQDKQRQLQIERERREDQKREMEQRLKDQILRVSYNSRKSGQSSEKKNVLPPSYFQEQNSYSESFHENKVQYKKQEQSIITEKAVIDSSMNEQNNDSLKDSKEQSEQQEFIKIDKQKQKFIQYFTEDFTLPTPPKIQENLDVKMKQFKRSLEQPEDQEIIKLAKEQLIKDAISKKRVNWQEMAQDESAFVIDSKSKCKCSIF